MKILTNARVWMMLLVLITSVYGFCSGKVIESGLLEYKVLSEKNRQVAVAGVVEDAPFITVPPTVVIDDVEYTVTELADQAFENCNMMKNIELPSTLTAIRYMAF